MIERRIGSIGIVPEAIAFQQFSQCRCWNNDFFTFGKKVGNGLASVFHFDVGAGVNAYFHSETSAA